VRGFCRGKQAPSPQPLSPEYRGEGLIRRPLRALGGVDYKNRDQDEYFNAFYLHTRIQVLIGHALLRCWFLIATDKNYYDRDEFLKRLRNDKAGRDAFYHLVCPLFDRDFFYEVLPDRLPLRAGLSQDTLVEFVLRDGPGFYSGIVKEYRPDDPALAADRIRDEMFGNFQLLYPLYDFIAWRPGRR
jgi:hypothetical protein